MRFGPHRPEGSDRLLRRYRLIVHPRWEDFPRLDWIGSALTHAIGGVCAEREGRWEWRGDEMRAYELRFRRPVDRRLARSVLEDLRGVWPMKLVELDVLPPELRRRIGYLVFGGPPECP